MSTINMYKHIHCYFTYRGMKAVIYIVNSSLKHLSIKTKTQV